MGNFQKRETLQAIGQDFGVTRERIRQIENDSFFRLARQKEKSDLKKVFAVFHDYLRLQGGLKREDIILTDLGRNDFQNYVYFLLNLGDSFFRQPGTQEVYPFWAEDQKLFNKAEAVLKSLVEKLEQEGRPLSEENLPKFTLSTLEIAKKIEKGPLGGYGLISWPEIKPRGVRDRAYLALQKAGRPLHFREIAKLSSELEFGTLPFQSENREVLPQTVHNELIRDERFVLVGRGIYALKEWGYERGTVKDIISKILKESRRPLSRQEILKEVLRQRFVKENTILLNLADKNYFQRDSQGRYILKNA